MLLGQWAEVAMLLRVYFYDRDVLKIMDNKLHAATHANIGWTDCKKIIIKISTLSIHSLHKFDGNNWKEILIKLPFQCDSRLFCVQIHLIWCRSFFLIILTIERLVWHVQRNMNVYQNKIVVNTLNKNEHVYRLWLPQNAHYM